MPTLYRKYRPQTFNSVIGQEHIIQTITNEISSGKIAQAYLFSGPRGTGKTTTARLLAKAINCSTRAAGTFEPCGTCSTCTEITAGRNIDVIEIDAASHTGVDNVRENIIENAEFKPTKSPFKVFIIDEVHMLSTSAFNALLKTVEEPPAHVVFIMATTELHKLPATIISRCQRFHFKKVSHDLMMKRLKELTEAEDVKVDKEVLEKIVNKSDGCLRDAESLLGQVLSLNLKKITTADAELILPTAAVENILNFLEAVINKNTATALTLLGQMVEEGLNLDQFAYDIIEILRKMMIAQTGLDIYHDSDYNKDTITRLKKLAESTTPTTITALLTEAMKRRLEIKTSPLPQLPLELFAVNFSLDQTEENLSKKSPPPETPSTPNTPPPAPTESAPNPTTPPPNAPHTLKETLKTAVNSLVHPHSHGTPPKSTLEEVKNKWADVIKQLSETNHSLTFILKMSDLIKIDQNGLEISVAYGFHKEKLEEQKAKKAVETCLANAMGEKINLTCTVKPVAAPTLEPVVLPTEEAQNLASDFGGEVVA